MLFSEPKIPQSRTIRSSSTAKRLSVLFSEPKIPQCDTRDIVSVDYLTFSALQRAENSSIVSHAAKIAAAATFSALQRAENSSMLAAAPSLGAALIDFQCSSASRKFLNLTSAISKRSVSSTFSALQRAENSSIAFTGATQTPSAKLSVLFSEPKIPQSPQRGR